MRSGFALPLTLVGMVVIGALAAAILFVALIGRRSGAAMLESTQVQFAAEVAAHRVVDGLSLTTVTSMPVSDAAMEVDGESLARFGSTVWFVEAAESGARFGSLRRAGLVLVSRPSNMLLRKGLTTSGLVSILGSGVVDLFGAGAADGCGVAAADSSSDGYESLELWMSRATRFVQDGAVVTPHPMLLGGVCDVTADGNWGDPSNPTGVCSSYFPVVGSAGDLTVEGGQGQGALIVAGNLRARAGFHFRGLVIVNGGLVLEEGAQMFGAVQVDDSSGEGSVLDNAQIVYSGCAIREAVSGFGMISALEDRGWFQPY